MKMEARRCVRQSRDAHEAIPERDRHPGSRLTASAGAASDHRDPGGASILRITVGVALGIVLAFVLLNLLSVAAFVVVGS
jgi:hypothetical protein